MRILNKAARAAIAGCRSLFAEDRLSAPESAGSFPGSLRGAGNPLDRRRFSPRK
jgi:hypothetical protein